jgi:glyoxalase family protein
MTAPVSTSGLHHVTAVGGDPQRNADFYRAVLGLRLVKQTVNFDDPETYHLYYGDEQGRPGTLLTFFPFTGAPPGRKGAGQAVRTAFSVPEHSLGWWADHLRRTGAQVRPLERRGDTDVLVVADPDGLDLELVATGPADERPPYGDSPVPVEHAVRGLDSVTLAETSPDATGEHLVRDLGFRLVEESGERARFAVGDGGSGSRLDVVPTSAPSGLVAAGTVHHVAWRAPDPETQLTWRSALVDRGHGVTPVLDRQYFRSIYFREPGGVLFEIATDGPGFDRDEPVATLGASLRLPPWLEGEREEVERRLRPLDLSGAEERALAGPG